VNRRGFLETGLKGAMLGALSWLPCVSRAAEATPGEPYFEFTDVSARAAIKFRHESSATGQKFLLETMGSGCAFLDFDGDGYQDIYFVNGGLLPGSRTTVRPSNALYRNNRDGTFTDVTDRAGVQGCGYGMGVVAADYNNDGLTDLFVTNFGSCILYRNNGDGTFTDVTAASGLKNGAWGTSAAFFDYDNDGFLDLFICNYVDFSLDHNVYCGAPDRGRGYCSPENFQGSPCALFHNNGDGTFTDVTVQSGIARLKCKALGVVTADFTGNGYQDIYVANDRIENMLFLNRGDGTFEEAGELSGAAFTASGRAQSGMGVAAADIDGDGRPDIVVTNLSLEGYSLFHNDGRGLFTDVSFPRGVGAPSLMLTGWGVAFFDYDNDGREDLIAVNGHAMDNVSLASPELSYPQPALLLRNDGGHFTDVTPAHGKALCVARAARGMAVGDYDNDGNLDLLICTCNGTPALVRNGGHPANHWVKIRPVGRKSNRDGIGLKAWLTAGGITQMKEITGGGSYLSSNDRRLHFGLGRSRSASVRLRWPSGIEQVLDRVDADKVITVTEPAPGQANVHG
jgi:hypothetical protein